MYIHVCVPLPLLSARVAIGSVGIILGLIIVGLWLYWKMYIVMYVYLWVCHTYMDISCIDIMYVVLECYPKVSSLNEKKSTYCFCIYTLYTKLWKKSWLLYSKINPKALRVTNFQVYIILLVSHDDMYVQVYDLCIIVHPLMRFTPICVICYYTIAVIPVIAYCFYVGKLYAYVIYLLNIQ